MIFFLSRRLCETDVMVAGHSYNPVERKKTLIYVVFELQ